MARDGGSQATGNQAGEPQKFALRYSDWSPADSSPHQEKVEVYSNCDEVELFLNGASLGTQQRPADDAPRLWTVTYAPGTLKASARNGGKEVATQVLQTAGPGSKILLETDCNNLAPDWDDICYVRATVVDSNGVRVPSATDELTFSTSGPGAIAAVDSGDLTSHEPFQVSQRKAFEGTCVAIVRATAAAGPITVTATAPGLTAGAVTINAVGADGIDSR
jgi:beta-galactosidase